MNARDRYRELVRNVALQKVKLNLPELNSVQWSKVAPGYRFDPFRRPGAILEEIGNYIFPNDVVLEIGGGAGRTALPLALHCKSVTNIEPSPGMCKEFKDLAKNSGIKNAHLIQSSWEEVIFPECDVVLIVDVTYFVDEIADLLKKMHSAARRRVIVSTWVPAPPNRNAVLFELVYQESLEPVPSHLEISDVLAEIGITPSFIMPPEYFEWPEEILTTRETAISFALDAVGAPRVEHFIDRIEQNFNTLFALDDGRFRPLWRPVAPAALLTWTTGNSE